MGKVCRVRMGQASIMVQGHPSHGIQQTLPRPVKVSTSFALYPDFFRLPNFLDWSDIQFFYSPTFPPQSVRLCLVTYSSLSRTYMTYRTPCFASSYQMLPAQPAPMEVEDLPGIGKHSKHVPLLTQLAWLQPIVKQLMIALSKNAFQNCSFKKHTSILLPQNCSLKKCISINTFQNYFFKIVITKIFFISASINAVKGKIDTNKSPITSGQNRIMYY